MAFAGQAPTIVVLREGPFRPHSPPYVCHATWLDFADLVIFPGLNRHGCFSRKGSDHLQHQCLSGGAIYDQEHAGPLWWGLAAGR